MEEDVSGDEDWEEISGTAIPTNACLFCEVESKDIERNLRYGDLKIFRFLENVWIFILYSSNLFVGT